MRTAQWLDDGAAQHLSRRRLLRAAATSGAGLSAAALLACGRKPNSGAARPGTAAGSASSPQKGGVLVHAGGFAGSFDTQGQGFDPYRVDQAPNQTFSLFMERLLAYNLQTYAVEPELAQTWEQPSQTEYVFHLQPNVVWQNKPPVNGRPLVVDDVLFSMERARTNDPKFLSRSFLHNVDKVTAPDAKTVSITTSSPDVSTLAKLSVDALCILAREALAKYPNLDKPEALIGTGAFTVKSIDDTVGGEYTRNPAYWKPGLPYLDGVRTHNLPDTLTAWASFQAKQLDVIRLPGTAVNAYLAEQPPGSSPAWFRDQGFAYLIPNTQRKPMDDARVTRALRLLVDHEQFINTWAAEQYGRGGYGSSLPNALYSWDLSDAEYQQQLEWKQPKDAAVAEALSLLAAAGYTPQNPLTFPIVNTSSAEYTAAGQLVQAQWKQLSKGAVNATIQVDTGNNYNVKATRSFTYALLGASAETEPDAWLSSYYRTGGSENFSGLSDPKLDAMIDEQRATFDDAKRRALVKQIVLYLIDHSGSTIPASRFFLNGVQPRVHGYAPEYWMNGRQYQSIWLSA